MASSIQHPSYHPSSSAQGSTIPTTAGKNAVMSTSTTTMPSSSSHLGSHYSMSSMPMTSVNVGNS